MGSTSATQQPHRALLGTEDTGVVTGEGVFIDIPPASVAARVGAGIIDLVSQYLAFAGLIVLFSNIAPSMTGAQIAITILVTTVFCLVGLPVLQETLTRGRTLGKLAFKLRVVRDDGGPIVFRHALVRALVRVVEVLSLQGVPALICAILSTRGKRLGDHAAGTYVVREETGMRLHPPAPVPAQLEPWARTADIGSLPDGVALHIRQYLGRINELTPAGRAHMEQALLAQVLPRVSPAPPAEAPAWAVLAAVLGERRRRDADRLARESHVRASLLR